MITVVQMIEGKEFEGKNKNLVKLELTVQEILETYPICLNCRTLKQ